MPTKSTSVFTAEKAALHSPLVLSACSTADGSPRGNLQKLLKIMAKKNVSSTKTAAPVAVPAPPATPEPAPEPVLPKKPAAPLKRAAKPPAKATAPKAAVPKTVAPKAVPPRATAQKVAVPKATLVKPKRVPKPATPTPTFTRDDIALRAYFISEKRRAHGLPGDEHQDWVEAERQLLQESAKRKNAKKT
jgi:hypothetical protein